MTVYLSETNHDPKVAFYDGPSKNQLDLSAVAADILLDSTPLHTVEVVLGRWIPSLLLMIVL